MNDFNEFKKLREKNTKKLSSSKPFLEKTSSWFIEASEHQYSYNFDWLGLPIIQFPQDIVAIQEIIWQTKPDLIIEAGVARGGSIIFHASMLHLLNAQNSAKRQVIGIDIDIRDHNRKAIEDHPLHSYVTLIEASSTDSNSIKEISSIAKDYSSVMVILDSNHTHEHVLQELHLYSPLVSKGNYLVVMDTIIDEMPESFSADRPWSPKENPKTAVHEFLKHTQDFTVEKQIPAKLAITVVPDGYLRRVR